MHEVRLEPVDGCALASSFSHVRPGGYEEDMRMKRVSVRKDFELNQPKKYVYYTKTHHRFKMTNEWKQR